MLIVDAANVVGSRPDGWWRDRAGAAERLRDDLAAALGDGRLQPPVVVVLEGQARRGVPEADVDGLRVTHARAEGDDEIVDIAERVRATGEQVVVVTADRRLRQRVEELRGEVVGPRWLLDRLVKTTR